MKYKVHVPPEEPVPWVPHYQHGPRGPELGHGVGVAAGQRGQHSASQVPAQQETYEAKCHEYSWL